jgi:hypothetical protein
MALRRSAPVTEEELNRLDRLEEIFARDPFSAEDARQKADVSADELAELCDNFVIEIVGKNLFRVADAGHG